MEDIPMKIERIQPFLVGRTLLVRVYTDEGIVGNGEAGLWAHQKVVYEVIQELSDYYVGKDPLRMEHHYQVISRDTHFAGAAISAAMSAMDIAMWDILAKSVNKPVYALLGGQVRDRIRVFANVGGDTLEARGESARQQVEKGYVSLRTTPFLPGFERLSATAIVKQAVQVVAAIRDAVGDEIDLGLEIHRNLDPDTAIMLGRELEPFRILYYEDPLAPESIEALDYVARHVDLPIATGERFYSIQQFKELMDKKTVAMIRPDVSLVGGFTQIVKIAGMAEASFIGVFPHLMGSPVNIAAFVQFAARTPNFRLMESNMVDTHPLNAVIDQPLTLQDGHILLPDRPGIGVEIVEEELPRFPYEPKRILGNTLRSDGSVAL
jgi:galactonate dehydratase